MKKLITIIILLITSITYSQDTVKKFIKIIDFGKPTQTQYNCIILSNGDTVCEKSIKDTLLINSKTKSLQTPNYDKDYYTIQTGVCTSGGKKEQSNIDTTEIIAELQNIQKVYKELYEQKVKALETTDADLLRLQGIMLYLNQKLENERQKK